MIKIAKRSTNVVTVAALLGVFSVGGVLTVTGNLDGFFSWAWARHHNILSWYIRPLFLLPLTYFSYQRSLSGITLTLVALTTSVFWFPAPERVDPQVETFLAFEKAWLTGEWPAEKIILTSFVPLILGILCLAFWQRSLVWGLAVINAIAVTKMVWGVVDGAGSGWVMLGPALTGLVLCNAAVIYAARRLRSSSHSKSDHNSNPTTGISRY